jgi:Glycosyltransferase family 87
MHLAPLGIHYYPPYVRLPVFSVLLRPLMFLPYWPAFWVWLGAGIAAYLASVSILIRHFRLPGYLVPAFAAFFPAVGGLIGGQDVTVLVFVLIISWLLLLQRRDCLAGLLLAGCLYKFNLVLLLPPLLICHRRYTALGAFAAGGTFIVVSSILMISPSEYFPVLTRHIPGFYPVGLLGFSQAMGRVLIYPVLGLVVLVGSIYSFRRLSLTDSFSVAVLGSLLVSPRVSWYDSTLLILPLALLLQRAKLGVRILCAALLIAVPAWQWGGGYSGRGYFHAAVEMFLLAYLLRGCIASGKKFSPQSLSWITTHESSPPSKWT